MKVLEAKHVEDCFDGSLIYELLLDEEMNKATIFALGKSGQLQYFDHFAKPFYKIRVPGLYDMKGVEGACTARIHLKSQEAFTLEDFEATIAGLGT